MRIILISLLLVGCATEPYVPPPKWQLYTYERTIDPTKVTPGMNVSTGYPSAHNDGLVYNPYTRSHTYRSK